MAAENCFILWLGVNEKIRINISIGTKEIWGKKIFIKQ